MKWILPINLKKEPMCFDINNEAFICFFEREEDLDHCVKKSNSLLVDAVCFENWNDVDEIIDFLLNIKNVPRIAIVKEINELGLTYEERIL